MIGSLRSLAQSNSAHLLLEAFLPFDSEHLGLHRETKINWYDHGQLADSAELKEFLLALERASLDLDTMKSFKTGLSVKNLDRFHCEIDLARQPLLLSDDLLCWHHELLLAGALLHRATVSTDELGRRVGLGNAYVLTLHRLRVRHAVGKCLQRRLGARD